MPANRPERVPFLRSRDPTLLSFHAESSNRYSSLRRYRLHPVLPVPIKRKKKKEKEKENERRSAKPLDECFSSVCFLPDFHGTLSDYEFLFEQCLRHMQLTERVL